MRLFKQRTPDFEVKSREALNAAFGKKTGHTALAPSGAVMVVDASGKPIEQSSQPVAKAETVLAYPTDDPEITVVSLQEAGPLLEDNEQ